MLSIVTFSGIPVHADQPLIAGRSLGSAATVDNEGNVIVVGSSSPFSNGQSQMFLLKYVPGLPDSPTGRLSCLKTFGNGGGNEQPLDTFGYSVVTDSSNNIYVTGSTQTFGGEDYDVFLQQYDQSCNLIYTVQWGGPGNDIARGIAVDAADNVYITGSTDSFGNGHTQLFLLKYTSYGTLQFSVTWGGKQNDYGNGVVVDTLGNIYVVGTTTTFGAGGSDVVLLKYDSSGNLLFQKTWGGTQNDFGTALAVDSGGYVYVTGYTYSLGPTPGVSSIILLKYDPSGNLLFQKFSGGKMNDFGTGIAVDIDGNVYVTGYTKSYSVIPGVPSAFLMKFDQSGNLLFQRSWGGHRGDFAYGVAVDSAENAYVTGYTYSFGPNTQGANFFVLKYDISGNLQYQKIYGGGIPDP
jgi:uncharacterized delta-60 repeat protein